MHRKYISACGFPLFAARYISQIFAAKLNDDYGKEEMNYFKTAESARRRNGSLLFPQ